MGCEHEEDIHALHTHGGIQNGPNIHQQQLIVQEKRLRNSGSRIHGSPCNSSAIVNRRTHLLARERLLRDGRIPPGRDYFSTLNTDTLGEMAETQEILPQHRNVVGAIRKTNDMATIHPGRDRA